MKLDYPLGFIVLSIFGLLGLGTFVSPAYSQQISYAQGFLLAGALLFIASVLIVVAAIGFRSYALYLAVLVAMAIAAYGLYGGILVLLLTYASWGFVFSLQLLLVYHHVQTAMEWFKERYTWSTFYAEYRIFYPALWFLYFFLEVVPHIFLRDHMVRFDPQRILHLMEQALTKD
jgi:hypothetical protein